MESKILKNIAKITQTKGFHILMKGDPEIKVGDLIWELRGNFYFDTKDELEQFRSGLKKLYENLCGEVTVLTIEEYNKQIEEYKW